MAALTTLSDSPSAASSRVAGQPRISRVTGTDPNAPILDLRGVHKSFGPNVIYRDMNLTVHEGETLTIIGGSGTGKSVCLKLIIGLLYPEQGEVYYRGRAISTMNHEDLRRLRLEVSMLFQGGALFDSMTVLENVGYALTEHTKQTDKQVRDRAAECLAMVGLDPATEVGILEKFPVNLSGGMRKRVALARSIAFDPHVILYDEPTTGLDPPNCDRIALMIRKLQRELNVTSIVVTHDIETAFYVSDRMAMLHNKNFPWIGTVDEMRAIQDPVIQDFINRKALGYG